MLFSWKIKKTCLDQLENKAAILDFGTLQKVTTLLQKLFRTHRRTHLPYLVAAMFLANHDKMSNLYRGPSIDASYQVSVHLAKRFQRRIFLDIDKSEARIAYGGHVCSWIETKLSIFIEDFPQMLPTKFQFISPSGFKGEAL